MFAYILPLAFSLKDLFRVLVYEPQLNLLYFLFQITGDIGISIILLAVLVNLLILPLFAKSYINMQKTRILQPLIAEIREKYKDNPKQMLDETRAFNKKHNINNTYSLLVLFIQLFFVSGLYFLVSDVVKSGQINGLYITFFGESLARFAGENGKLLAFGSIDVGAEAIKYLFFPILTSFLSYLFGLYTTKLAPKPKLPVKPKPKSDKPEAEKLFDPEAFQKSMEFQTVYVMPIILFAIQYTLPTGLNIYMATSTALSLIRQIGLTQYYSSHTEKLMQDIIDSDPVAKDGDPSNNLEITATPADIASQPVATKVESKKMPKKQELNQASQTKQKFNPKDTKKIISEQVQKSISQKIKK